MSFSLNGKVALVTGAGQGLGLEISRGLAMAGAVVLLNGRDGAKLDAAAAAVGQGTEPLPFDVGDETAVAQAFATIKDRFGRLDILVNNAALRDRRGLFEVGLDAVRRVLDIDLVAPLELARRAAPLMSGGGRIINITSIAG
ncbi:MAG: SDR family NAD(P)-dependent oxidoreductase, partial [Rhodospirillaceae bacterium]